MQPIIPPHAEDDESSNLAEASMTDFIILTASRLRKRAAHCRKQADAANSEGIAAEFHALATDYEDDAGRLESRAFTPREAVRFGLR
jgi:hypothetical protein